MEFIKTVIAMLNDKLHDERTTNPDASSVSIILTLGKRVVEAYITEEEVQVNIINPQHYMRFYENVCQYIEDHMNDWEDVEVKPYDMWDDHGFRNEADYLRYRYG